MRKAQYYNADRSVRLQQENITVLDYFLTKLLKINIQRFFNRPSKDNSKELFKNKTCGITSEELWNVLR